MSDYDFDVIYEDEFDTRFWTCRRITLALIALLLILILLMYAALPLIRQAAGQTQPRPTPPPAQMI